MELLQSLINGISEGSIIALVALGLTLSFGIARFANVAHGDYVTVGAYAALLFNTLGANIFLAAVLAIPITVAVGLLAHFQVFRPLANRPFIASVIASIGVALVLRHVLILIAGTGQFTFDLPLRRALRFGELRVNPTDLWIVALTAVFTLGVYGLLNFTRLGKNMRAVADNPRLARVAGIDPQRTMVVMWIVVLVLATVAGVLFGLRSIVTPYMGWQMLIAAFAAVILGGVGNPYGAVAGGLIIGVSQELATFVVAPTYKLAVAFVILTVVLLFRPSGLFGEERLVR